MRSFIGIPVPEAIAGPLAEFAGRTGLERAVPREYMHLTLAFLDDQPQPVLADLADTLSVLDMPDCEIRLRGMDVYGGSRPRVLVAAADPSAPLAELRDTIRGAASAHGIVLPRERFRPHVTLVRLRRTLTEAQRARLGAAVEGASTELVPPFRAHSVVLYGSHLGPKGARYDTLAEFHLGQPGQ